MKKSLTKELVTHPLKCVKDENSRILILGSFPSVKSRELNFFYMNKTNRFYKVLSSLTNEDFYSCDIDTKISLLHKYHIALYDVVDACYIHGSSDSSIEIVSYLNLEEILKDTKIEHIYLNGNKAYELFSKKYPEYLKMSTLLPSTSSANARMKLEDLVEAWAQVLE